MDAKQEFFDQQVDKIKPETIQYKESEIEHHSYSLKKIDNIKEERNVSEVKEMHLYIGVSEIKKESCEFVETKTASELLLSLTSHCDLPTLKDEITEHPSYLDQPYSSKEAEGIFKPLKDTAKHVSKKRKMMYPRPVCAKNFPSSKSRSTHINGHFEKRYTVCQFCGRMKQMDLFQHCFIRVVKNKVKNHIADKSLKANISFKKLNRKNINDVDDKSFKCGTCDKTFYLKYDLRIHLKTHNGQKPFKCNICAKSFTEKSNLRQHLIIHTGEKPFKCDICSKCFTQKSHLRQHLIIHSGQKPFKCNICGKSFTKKSTLQLHLIIHTGEKPFKCDICSKGYTQKPFLQQHLMTHIDEKPFKCDICSKGFIKKSNLQQHLIVHSGQKPFNCNICAKSFTQKSTLQRHLIIHTSERPFKCNICSRCFTQKSSLQLHLKIHDRKKTIQLSI